MTKKFLDLWSESFLDKYEIILFKNTLKGIFNNEKHPFQIQIYVLQFNLFYSLFVCVEVLRPSQSNGVMSSAVSLPNHTFTG